MGGPNKPDGFSSLIFFESGSVLLAGCLIGMAAGLVGQDLIDGWLHQTTGSPVTFSPAWQLGLRTVAIAAGISILAAGATIVQTGRYQPRAAFSVE